MKPDWLSRTLFCAKPSREHDTDLRSEYCYHALWPLVSGPFLPDAFDLVTLGAFRSGSRITRVDTHKNARATVSTHWYGAFEGWHDYEQKWIDSQSDEPFVSVREVRRRWLPPKIARALLGEVLAYMQLPEQRQDLADGCQYMAVVRKNGFVRVGSFPVRDGAELEDLLTRVELGCDNEQAAWEK